MDAIKADQVFAVLCQKTLDADIEAVLRRRANLRDALRECQLCVPKLQFDFSA